MQKDSNSSSHGSSRRCPCQSETSKILLFIEVLSQGEPVFIDLGGRGRGGGRRWRCGCGGGRSAFGVARLMRMCRRPRRSFALLVVVLVFRRRCLQFTLGSRNVLQKHFEEMSVAEPESEIVPHQLVRGLSSGRVGQMVRLLT
ncbi:uncharacterized protein HMPREF1120_06449 [Exophiala dermatitidis NIH/UT8656]|uniref:Uncharacterized protein n=1 Tax=Exophiala dermatitidis (strain ATCC 34100 / CBS 525.76 / NIH/UT8656) TaxID=858893 RepID=H6C4A3_EXODN|nr:uncharacterized protein HMPREF1120_06449 [Exophiala dermatitidis NIH/UT8656]EHY58439.1 hypothetical protein HMPREF1120_06449 [Exophiala dermatitidis NIH/UT8656]